MRVQGWTAGTMEHGPGSPTIRIDGADIDPTYEDTGDYMPRCRVYLTPDGYTGVPKRELVEAAVQEALLRNV